MVDREGHLQWIELSRTKIAEYGLFDIYAARRTAGRRDAEFLLLDAPDWVTIVPYIEEKEAFLMVRQYRHGSGTVTLEFPAGIVDSGECAAEAARRELLEETGCTAGTFDEVAAVNPNPAFMTNRVHTFVATGLVCDAELDLDENEILDVETVPVERVAKGLGTDPFINGIMVISYTWFVRWRERRRPKERER